MTTGTTMVVDATGTWLLIAACCAVAVPLAVRVELRRTFYREHAACRQAPGRFAAALAGAVLDGIGAGMAVALVALMLAALAERIGA